MKYKVRSIRSTNRPSYPEACLPITIMELNQ